MISPVRQSGDAVLIAVKAVPGASRDAVAAVLASGRLKFRVAAPPEGGRANRAVCALIARALGLRPAAVTITAGLSSPEKTVRAEGITAGEAEVRLISAGGGRRGAEG